MCGCVCVCACLMPFIRFMSHVIIITHVFYKFRRILHLDLLLMPESVALSPVFPGAEGPFEVLSHVVRRILN
jgi:hypothetical protein